LIFLGRRDHLFHPFLDLVDLRMHFLDEVVFNLGQSLKWAMPFKAVPPAGGGFHVAKRHLMGFPVPRVAGTAFKSIALSLNSFALLTKLFQKMILFG
jgi:hypothetical protein